MFLDCQCRYVGRDGRERYGTIWSNGWSTNVNLPLMLDFTVVQEDGGRPSKVAGGKCILIPPTTKMAMQRFLSKVTWRAGEALRGCGVVGTID